MMNPNDNFQQVKTLWGRALGNEDFLKLRRPPQVMDGKTWRGKNGKTQTLM